MIGGVAIAQERTLSPSAAMPCTCRAGGVDHPLGAEICMPTPAGPRKARCGLALNNTSWSATDTPCETASVGASMRIARLPPSSQ